MKYEYQVRLLPETSTTGLFVSDSRRVNIYTAELQANLNWLVGDEDGLRVVSIIESLVLPVGSSPFALPEVLVPRTFVILEKEVDESGFRAT